MAKIFNSFISVLQSLIFAKEIVGDKNGEIISNFKNGKISFLYIASFEICG